MNIKEAKEIDMVDYLSKLGYEPKKVRGNEYWYCSPLHDDDTPSFKVNRKLNRWTDFGGTQRRGGNLVDFGILFHGCDISQFLERLGGPARPFVQHKEIKKKLPAEDDRKNQITIVKVAPITSQPLIAYYRSRKIPRHIAEKYLMEATYILKDKSYYALAFKTDTGGYELRNQYIKAASMPKGPTFIDNGAKSLAVFEGSFDFLSYLTVYDKLDVPNRNFLILNSTSFFEQSLPRMLEHDHVHLYVDNNKTGDACVTLAHLREMDLGVKKFTDERGLYKNYGDFNEWLQKFGAPPVQRTQLRL